MNAHTPGPWKRELCQVRCIDGHTPTFKHRPIEERVKNASLIAAAPELLAALKGLVAHCDEANLMGESDFEQAWMKARAAIVKAEVR
jgi:hypothetical protein